MAAPTRFRPVHGEIPGTGDRVGAQPGHREAVRRRAGSAGGMEGAPVSYVGGAGLTVHASFPFFVGGTEGMRKTVLLTASMAAAVLLACGAAALAAGPG